MEEGDLGDLVECYAHPEFQEVVYYNDAWHDQYIYAMLEDEWKALVRAGP